MLCPFVGMPHDIDIADDGNTMNFLLPVMFFLQSLVLVFFVFFKKPKVIEHHHHHASGTDPVTDGLELPPLVVHVAQKGEKFHLSLSCSAIATHATKVSEYKMCKLCAKKWHADDKKVK